MALCPLSGSIRRASVWLVLVMMISMVSACSDSPTPDKETTNNTSNNDATDAGGNACTGANCADVGTDSCGGCDADLFCDETSGVCVECVVDAQCAGGAICDQVANVCACPQGTHECDKACVPNDAVGTCGDRCQPCPGDPNGTAVCNVGTCELDCDEGLSYDPASNSCVECAISNECADPATPTCSEGFCVAGCTSNDDCAGREATPVCNVDTGACVECSATDTSVCGDFVCDAQSGQCTETLAGSLGPCAECEFDAECSEGFACVPAEFKGTVRASSYCYAIPDATEGCPGGGFATEVTRTSAQGDAPETFCSINESLTTCEAFLDYGTQRGLCSQQDDCGVEIDDALCEPTEFSSASCTFLCDTTADCPPVFEAMCMPTPEGLRYCGAY